MKRKLLNILVDARPSDSPRTIDSVDSTYQVVDYVLGSGSSWLVLIKAFFLPHRFAEFDAVLTSEYFSSFAVNLRLLVTLCKTRHVTVGLNQSRRLLKLGRPLLDAIINKIFDRGNLYVVHSTKELKLFHDLHRIHQDRLVFSHWGFDRPSVGGDSFRKQAKPYVLLIGRNNRDFQSFCIACDGQAYDGIIVCSSNQKLPEPLPPNVHVLHDLPMDEAMSCILHASANLVLVKDSNRGAGHITAVAGMLLGTPQISSDMEVLNDYLIDDFNCITIAPRNIDAIRRAIDTILLRPDFREKLVANGLAYASRWLTHSAAQKRVFESIDRMFANKPQHTIDPQWEEFISEITAPPAASAIGEQ